MPRNLMQGLDRTLRYASIAAFVLLTACLVIDAIGIPRTLEIAPSDIRPTEIPNVYTVTILKPRLRLLEIAPEAIIANSLRSSAHLFEDGKPAGYPIIRCEDLPERGAGYCTRPRTDVSFMTADKSDPRTNGRHYRVDYRLAIKWHFLEAIALLLALLRVIVVLRHSEDVHRWLGALRPRGN